MSIIQKQKESAWSCRATPTEVAALIRGRREALGLTQYEMARRMGSTQSTVARWEAGEHAITMATLSRIADALGVEFLIQFGREGSTA